MNINLTGKSILVTGASRGIGKEIARALAKSGARIAVHFNQKKEEADALVKEIGNDSKAFQADLENADSCYKLFYNVVREFKHIDVLVNNAGIFLTTNLTDNKWLEEWNKTMDVNLRATAILCNLAIQHFQDYPEGRIINIASRAAFRGDNPEHLAYAASKGGMVALTKSIARGFGKNGIVAFLIAPGWVKTDMNKETIARMGKEAITKDLALNRLTEPRDLAPLIVLLSSGMADHATGTTIDVNAASYVH